MKLSRKEKIVWACVIAAWAGANLIYYFMYMREPAPVPATAVSQQNAHELLHQTLEIAYNDRKNILVHVSGPG